MAVRYKAIGQNIRKKRKALGLTQERMAESIDMSDIHYGRIERGDRCVSLDQLERIADVLGMGVKELLTGAFPDRVAGQMQQSESQQYVCGVMELMDGMNEECQRLMFDFCYLLAADF